MHAPSVRVSRVSAPGRSFQELLKTDVLEQNTGLLELLQKFLDQSSYEKERSQSSNVAKAVVTMKSSVKSVSEAVTAVPGQIVNTMDNVVDGITKVLLPVEMIVNRPVK